MPAKAKKMRKTQSVRAALTFPVARVHRMLRSVYSGRLRVSKGAGTYLTAVLEYMSAELLEIAGNCCRDMKQKRLTPRHLQLSIRMDEEMNKVVCS